MSNAQEAGELWKKESDLMKKFLADPQAFYDSIKNKEKITRKSGEIMEIVCMDGRLNESNKEKSVFVRDGGAGILRDSSEGIPAIAAGYVISAKQLGVKKIRLTSHGECGAWGLSGKNKSSGEEYYLALKNEIEKQIMADAGLRGNVSAELSHIPDEEHDYEGKGLCGMHNERVVYYADIPSFNPHAAEGIPAGFVVSRRHFSPEYAEANVAIAIKIAFGEHGFSEKFSESEPFVLVAVADSEDRLENCKIELEEAKIKGINDYLLESMENEAEKETIFIHYGVRIRIAGIIAGIK